MLIESTFAVAFAAACTRGWIAFRQGLDQRRQQAESQLARLAQTAPRRPLRSATG